MKWFLTVALFAALGSNLPAAEGKVDFNREVRPILAEFCFQCHGPDEKQRKSGLRLDTREGATHARKRGAAVVPGKAADSLLIGRMLSDDPGDVMPPPELGKKPTPAQVETLKRWVEQGAQYEGHWAFLPPVRPALPEGPGPEVRSPIDRLIEARLRKEGWGFAPPADDVTLVRRLYQDLTGLPPTPLDVDRYLNDASPGKYEALVDALLASPRYGERMALEWLDAARFADTHGYHIDSGRDMTRWREWVIEAFNGNMPFDRFTVEQIAGDLLPDATRAQKIASGFHRNHMINFEGGAIPAEYHNAYVVDRVNTTGTVWLGLTVGCAQCHDHKYDPISQKEYYQLYAFFHNVPENGIDGQKGNAVPRLPVPTPAQEARLAGLRERIRAAGEQLKNPWPEVDAAQAAWEATPQTGQSVWTALKPLAMRAEGGGALTGDAQQVVRVEGANPARERYTLKLALPKGTLTGLKLEVFADPSLKAGGPGRSENGNFVLTGVQAKLLSPTPREVKFRSATADFSQDTFPVAGLLQGERGWAIHPQTGRDHFAVLQFAEALNLGDAQELEVTLAFRSAFAQHQFARFRLLGTTAADPHTAAGLPEPVRAALSRPAAERTPEQLAALKAHYRTQVSPPGKALQTQLTSWQKELQAIQSAIPDAMVMEEMAKPRDTFVLTRGQYDQKGERVTAGTPAILPPLPQGVPANRLALARWLVAPDHPLTARVTVNRLWQMHFGTGLVKTAEDFGVTGEWPSHPELLDWLAVEFRESGWDLKRLQRLILTSRTYRQSSRATPEQVRRDPENRLLARMTRLRLPAEFIRDSALSVSGLLYGEIGGQSVSPYQPKGTWEELTFRQDNANFSAQLYVQSRGRDLYRRTMYTFWKRTAPPPSLVTLDAPDREVCTVRRPRTNTPLQALILMNDPTYVEASRKLAERVLREGGNRVEERLRFAFREVLSRPATERELQVLRQLLERQRASFAARPQDASKLLQVGEAAADPALDPVELAAWAMVANALLNLDEAITRN